ncbi:MAG: hypothetical protein ACLP7P_02040 [Rhodomicrobium sp.]
MKTFSSLAAVMALWLSVSFLLWLVYRLFRRRDGSKQRQLLSSAVGLAGEGASIFAALRTRASTRVTPEGNYRLSPSQAEDTLREDVRSLLNGIEAQAAFFERVNAVRTKIQQSFGVPDFLALSEILQIRRDFWAASEIFLMEGIRELGPELADPQSLETFQSEARSLLFKDEAVAGAEPGGRDPIDLRLAIAREDALAFQAEAERAIAAGLEKSRFPTPAELIAVPWSLLKGVAAALRETRYLLGDAVAAAHSLARAMTSKGLKGAAEELRRARTDMPGQFATAFERAGGLARHGGQGLKRHYEFVLEAQELRARYAELLARAPDLSEKGKQFLARLELERRAEQFRATSEDLSDWARQKLVAGIAHLIAGLQALQAKVTPAEHKQLAPLPASPASASAQAPAAEPEKPLRVLLLPASAYSGGNYGQAANAAGRRRRPRPEPQDSRAKAKPEEAILAGAPGRDNIRLRDLVMGKAALGEEEPAPKPVREPKASKQSKPRVSYSEGLKKKSFKDLLAEAAVEPEDDFANIEAPREAAKGGRRERPRSGGGSLLQRLSSIEPEEQTLPAGGDTECDKPKAKGWRLPFGSKQK